MLNIFILPVEVILIVFCVISIACIWACVVALTLVSIFLLILSHKIESGDVAISLTTVVLDLVVWQIELQVLGQSDSFTRQLFSS